MRCPGLLLACALIRTHPSLVAQELLPFSVFNHLPNGEVQIEVANESNGPYRLEVASALPNWQGWITASGSSPHTDAAAPYLPARFYRAVGLEAGNPITGDHLPTENGEAVLHPIEHASVVLSWNGLTIYVDAVGSTTLYTGLPGADLILVTHSHGDHYNSSTIAAVRNPGAPIIAPPEVINLLSRSLREGAISLSNHGTTNLLGLTVEAIPAYNSRHPQGAGNSYVLGLGGKRVLFSGDTEDVPEMRALTGIDVAFLCMNLPFTMSVEAAASAVRDFQPRVVYPYHYRNQDGSFANLQSFKQMVGTDQGVEVRIRDWY